MLASDLVFTVDLATAPSETSCDYNGRTMSTLLITYDALTDDGLTPEQAGHVRNVIREYAKDDDHRAIGGSSYAIKTASLVPEVLRALLDAIAAQVPGVTSDQLRILVADVSGDRDRHIAVTRRLREEGEWLEAQVL